MNGRLAGKVAIITGAGSGMGEAMARRFCAEGAKVIAADISGKQVGVSDSLGENCLPFSVDVSNANDVRAMINLAAEHFGRLDILCNNAGMPGAFAKTADYDDDEYEKVMSVNSRSVFLGMKYGIRQMLLTGGGSIVNTCSIAALAAFTTMPAYCASKGAVAMLTKCAAAEYAAEGIRINAIMPGAINTGMSKLGGGGTVPGEYVAEAVKATLMGRIGTPDEAANSALFLASDESSFITGALLTVDGGFTLV